MKLGALKGNFLLLMAAIIWGTGFVAQKLGTNYLGPLSFSAAKFIIGAIVLLPVIVLLNSINKKNKARLSNKKGVTSNQRDLLIGSLLCGAATFMGTWFQQWGLEYTTAGKAGFITALYIVIVPVLGLFSHKRTGVLLWLGVFLAMTGLYLLSIKEGLVIQKGDAIVLIGSFFWALQILIVDAYVGRIDGLKLAFLQLVVAGVLATGASLILENPEWKAFIACIGPLLYAGIVIEGIACTLQIIGQRYTGPTVTAIIFSLEAVFAVIAGTLILNEIMNVRELLGCGLMLSAFFITFIKPKGKEPVTEPAATEQIYKEEQI